MIKHTICTSTYLYTYNEIIQNKFFLFARLIKINDCRSCLINFNNFLHFVFLTNLIILFSNKTHFLLLFKSGSTSLKNN